jgi:hypothetical protein
MKTKAFILKIDDKLSNEYAKVCSDSCDDVGLDWEYFNGYSKTSGKHAWALTGINLTRSEGRPIRLPDVKNIPRIENPHAREKAECCSAGHAAIWKRIAESDLDVGVVLEHDAYMYYNINDIKIPDGVIVVLGYKTNDPNRYDHKLAGRPKELIGLRGHEGAHAYAMTKGTARFLIHEIETIGRLGCVDNAYFILNQRKTKVPLAIVSPTPAVGWLRESTIWDKSANRNYPFIPSFLQNYK